MNFCPKLAATILLSILAPMLPASRLMAADEPNGAVSGLKPKYAEVSGIRTRYYEMGSGDPLVLVHGGGMASGNEANLWDRNIPGLAKKFHVFAFDRLASRGTANPPTDDGYRYPAEVDFIYHFIKAMNLNQVHLVAHSYGANLAFLMAIQHPEVVKTLTLISGNGPAAIPANQSETEVLARGCPAAGTYEGGKCRQSTLAYFPDTFGDQYWAADATFKDSPRWKEAREKLNNGAARMADLNSWRQSSMDKEKSDGVLQMPILIYSGQYDTNDWLAGEAPGQLKGQRSLFELVSAKNTKTKWIILPNSGHFVEREYPGVFDEDLISFIEYWNHHPNAPAQGKIAAESAASNQ